MSTRDSAALDGLLRRATETYASRNPLSHDYALKARKFFPGGSTRSALDYAPFPIVMQRGCGGRLWDVDGHEYIDFLGDFTAGLFGHSNPVIRRAVDAALDDGISLSAHNILETQLAELIIGRFPSIERVRFTNSGTEASLMALTLARVATGKSKFLVFRGGYHGSVLSFGQGSSISNVPYDFIVAEYNDCDAAAALIARHGAELAAVMVEPMLGAGGCLPGTAEFLATLRRAASDHETILIFDEVQTSRLSGGGRQEMLGIRPDLTVLGKYLGGGSSFGAFGGRRDLMEFFNPDHPRSIRHSGTFNNNIISMAAGIAGLRDVFTPDRATLLTRMGDRLRERLNEICRRHGVPLQFLGLGSIMAAHATAAPLHRPADLGGADERIRDLLFFHLIEDGIYIAKRGLLALNLELTEADMRRLADSVERVALILRNAF